RLLGFRAVDAVVIVLVGAVVDYLAVPDDEHAVNVAILAASQVGVELPQHFGVESGSGWRSGGPTFGRPLRLGRRIGGEEEYGERDESQTLNAHRFSLLLRNVSRSLAHSLAWPRRLRKMSAKHAEQTNHHRER